METGYKEKYLKYKNKYLELKEQLGGDGFFSFFTKKAKAMEEAQG